MKTTKKQIIIFALLLLFFSAQFILIQSSPKTCDAADSKLWDLQKQSGMDEIGKTYGGENPKNDIKQIVVNIIKVFLGFIAIIFVILIIFAGFKYMTSAGNEEKITEAISQIKAGVIGLIIILSAYAITAYITDCILDITTGSWTWMCK